MNNKSLLTALIIAAIAAAPARSQEPADEGSGSGKYYVLAPILVGVGYTMERLAARNIFGTESVNPMALIHSLKMPMTANNMGEIVSQPDDIKLNAIFNKQIHEDVSKLPVELEHRHEVKRIGYRPKNVNPKIYERALELKGKSAKLLKAEVGTFMTDNWKPYKQEYKFGVEEKFYSVLRIYKEEAPVQKPKVWNFRLKWGGRALMGLGAFSFLTALTLSIFN